MYVCICQAVSDTEIRRAVADGARTFAQVQDATGCSTGCGCCEPDARRIFDDATAEIRHSMPIAVAA